MRLVRALLLAALAAAASAEVAVASADVRERALSAHRVRDILLGSVATWEDGKPIVVILVDEPDAAAALKAITGREMDALLRGWKRLVYAGSGAMPVVVRSPREALDELRRRPGAMALLAENPRAADLRVLHDAGSP